MDTKKLIEEVLSDLGHYNIRMYQNTTISIKDVYR